MKTTLWTVAALGLLTGACLPAHAAPQQPAEVTFSNAEFSQLAKLMTGSWRAAGVKAGDGTVDIVLSLAPVAIKDVPDAMYAEVARAEALEAPYRQTILQFTKVDGKTHIITYEFNTPNNEIQSLRTIWAAPDAFPAEVTREKLSPTTDAVVSGTGPVFTATSSQPYAGTTGGATTITSDMEISPAALKIADRGLAADGSVVWGPAKGEWMTFERASTGVSTSRLGDGLIVINYPSNIRSDRVAKNNDLVVAHYIGSIGDGTAFDTSFERGSPFRYNFDGPMLDGWKRAMGDVRVGMKRKLIIPGAMGWKDKGYPRKGIGPNATLFFQIEILDIQEQVRPENLPPVEIKPDDMNTKPMDQQKLDQQKLDQPKLVPLEKKEEKHDHPH